MKGLAGVVLAAGLGTRLRPLTDLLPKALCPVANVPLLDGALARIGEVTDAVAVNAHHHREQMERHLDGRAVHLSIEEGEALGTAGALGRLRAWIDGRPTVLHNADAWHTADLAPFVEGWDGECVRLLTVPAVDGGTGDFDGRTYAGVALLPWRDVAPLEETPSGLWEVSWRQAHAEGRVEAFDHAGAWFDTGTPATYLAANLAANGGESVVATDADVDPTAVLTRSLVWPGGVVAAGEVLVEQIRAPGPLTVAATQGGRP